MPVLDVRTIDTTPGADPVNPFTPPSGWVGGSEDYRDLLRQRYRRVDHYQRIYRVVHFAQRQPVNITGPYAEEATCIIETLSRKK